MKSIRQSSLLLLLALSSRLVAQRQPGHPIGKVTTIGNLIHLELDSGAIAPERLFDLDHRTLRFTPDGAGFRVENVALVWDAEFGPALSTSAAPLTRFKFPFSGREWDTLNVATGSITFGAMQGGRGGARGGGPPIGNRTGAGGSGRAGFQMERYAVLQSVGRTFINMIPGIAAFTRVGLNGQRFMKELDDRAVVTWTLTEGAGGIQAFSWTPTVNRIQATLHKNGVIELSYNDVNAKDAVVGVFPLVTSGVEKPIATVAGDESPNVAPNLDIKSIKLTEIDGLFLKATIETRGPAFPDPSAVNQQGVDKQAAGTADPAINGVTYRIALNKTDGLNDAGKATAVWTIRGFAGGRGFGGGRGMGARLIAAGDGAEPDVVVSGNTITVKGILPTQLSGVTRAFVSADASASPTSIVDRIAPRAISLTDIRSPEVDLSATTPKNGVLPIAYEGFHWPEIPRATDVACSVITALGDKFDFLVSYSDFRVDNPEGGTPSTGPRGGNVSGIGTNTNGLENYCSKGQLQWMYVEPVSTAAVQSQERSPDGRMTDYNYAMSQVGHELGHRWAADARAIVGADTITLGPVHWAAGVHLPAAFTYSNPQEADAMGGSTWKDNGDGTWTQLDRDYYSPAKGFSWLGLYLMGLAKPDEVQPFFILRNLQRTGQSDAQGHPIYKGDKTVITIQDVIAAMGPRVPDFDHSQKQFNTAMVVVTEHGKPPSKELLTAATNIAAHWITYWSKVTGGRASMTVSPR
ncbi:MAG TPA: hypothetical protein VGP95_19965 [Gemmatimonadaceae bacterium]|nr:hypothetical protein [Gemmatimonadaceae bacterium]